MEESESDRSLDKQDVLKYARISMQCDIYRVSSLNSAFQNHNVKGSQLLTPFGCPQPRIRTPYDIPKRMLLSCMSLGNTDIYKGASSIAQHSKLLENSLFFWLLSCLSIIITCWSWFYLMRHINHIFMVALQNAQAFFFFFFFFFGYSLCQ